MARPPYDRARRPVLDVPRPLLTSALLPPGKAYGRPREKLWPQGIVLHSTAMPEIPARQIRDFFMGPPAREASAHIVTDSDEALILIPLLEVAWHAGRTANHRFVGLELCETTDPAKFHRAYRRMIAVVQLVCDLFGWPIDDAHIWSHQRVSETFRESDHVDPIRFLADHGHPWEDVLADLREGRLV